MCQSNSTPPPFNPSVPGDPLSGSVNIAGPAKPKMGARDYLQKFEKGYAAGGGFNAGQQPSQQSPQIPVQVMNDPSSQTPPAIQSILAQLISQRGGY